jgi:DNA modification methylase
MSNVEELLKNCHLTQDKIENNIEIKNTDGINYLKEIENNSIDLVLTDPPYIISRESGMNTFYKNVKQNENNSMKTEDDWNKYKTKHKIDDDSQKLNYIKYGTIYGKKYSVQTDYGDWDQTFTLEMLDEFINEFYKKLKDGGTLIMFFDIWKISNLKELFEKNKFKQIRYIEWIKTNPQPLNSKTNYLTNCREIALVGIKKSIMVYITTLYKVVRAVFIQLKKV